MSPSVGVIIEVCFMLTILTLGLLHAYKASKEGKPH
jgi:hypothetical protein